jgi:outer membrane protein assembly factor BamD
MKKTSLTILLLLLITGCADKRDKISEQTPLFWHNKIYKDLSFLNIDQADDDFTSLEVEHPNSDFIPTNLLILFYAHYKNGEYKLAEFYLDEYKKRYANRYEKEWCDYMKIKIKFLSFDNSYTNQKKLLDTLKETKEILKRYPNSPYRYELNSIKAKLEATIISFDNKIASLYKRVGKEKSVAHYKKEENQTIIPPYIPWYKKLFYW